MNQRWRELSKKERHWPLFTQEQPTVSVFAGFTGPEVRRARYLLQTFATTQSALMKKRVSRSLVSAECPRCPGKRLHASAPGV